MTVNMDDDALVAAVDLIGRTGARGFEIGYMHDGVPVDQAGWYAHAQYRGARVIEQDHSGPIEAAEALARQLLTGGQCQHCKKLITLFDGGAIAYANAKLLDGTPWPVERAAAAGMCRWRRVGPRWVRGCEGQAPPPRPKRKPRRVKRRKRG